MGGARSGPLVVIDVVAALAVTVVMAGVAVGCGGQTTPEGPVSLLVGGTEASGDGFTPLTGDVTLVPGAQGGFHVWLKYRVTGMPAGPMRVRHSATRAEDGRPVLVGQSRPVDIGAAGPDGAWEAPKAAPAFMCPAPIGTPIDGTRIRFRVELLDANDSPVVSGDAEATPHCPDGDQATFCAHICSG
jgi:hypothetical protein